MIRKTIHPEAFMWATEQQLQTIVTQCEGIEFLRQEPLSRHTSFRTGGPAALMAFPRSEDELRQLLCAAASAELTPYLLGAGTNVLAPDEGLRSLVICLKDALCAQQLIGERKIQVFAGQTLAKAAVFAKNHALSGLEFAHGIPGTVGGAVYMNAGAYGGEMKQVVREVTAFTLSGEKQTISAENCEFSYRSSVFQRNSCVIFSAVLELFPGETEEIGRKMRELMDKRKASQPLDLPSAGSTFRRPTGYFAGPLIEQAGLKGQGVGGARVSEKHAGFVVNAGGATTQDIRRTIELVQQRVLETSGVVLEPEVRIW